MAPDHPPDCVAAAPRQRRCRDHWTSGLGWLRSAGGSDRRETNRMGIVPRAGTLAAAALTAALTAALAAGVTVSTAFITPALAQTAGKIMTTPSGLKFIDTKVGTGASPRTGQTCVMHYTGWLYENDTKGAKFDSSLDRGQPFEFPIGTRRVIAGWDEGVASMKVGGKRTLIIPPELGYGARGAGGVIPPNATLLFEVELLDVKG
jgi:peptidylprolyl isomerase